MVWVVPLSVLELTPKNPSTPFYGVSGFGVRKTGEPFRVLTCQSVLYPTDILQAR